MKYNTANPEERKAARSYFTTLANKKTVIEVKKINPTRTISQNSYLHLIIGAFGAHFGYTLLEAKQIYKELNRHIYAYEKNKRVFWKSSAVLTKDEMANTIDHFIMKSAEAGCPLPLADDVAWLRELENSIESSSHYL